MPVPAKRKANSGGRRRRSHDALTAVTLSSCVQCGTAIQPHRACRACGYYKGRSVLDTAKAAARLVKKSQKKS